MHAVSIPLPVIQGLCQPADSKATCRCCLYDFEFQYRCLNSNPSDQHWAEAVHPEQSVHCSGPPYYAASESTA